MIGGKANMPLAAAFSCNWRAISRICSGSAVEARMNSTGKLPPPGSAGGVTARTLIPEIFSSLAESPGKISLGVRSRSLHDLSRMPLKPDEDCVSWKLKSVSGSPK